MRATSLTKPERRPAERRSVARTTLSSLTLEVISSPKFSRNPDFSRDREMARRQARTTTAGLARFTRALSGDTAPRRIKATKEEIPTTSYLTLLERRSAVEARKTAKVP